MPGFAWSTPKKEFHRFEVSTRQVAVRNTGVNTLWVSFDEKEWHDVACGTSWDDRLVKDGFWHMTQTGKTSFVVIGIQLDRPRD